MQRGEEGRTMHQFEREDPLREEDRHSLNRALMLPGADGNAVITWLLLAINIIVWLLMQLTAGSVNTDVSILLRFGAMFGPLIATGEYWRLFTAMFLHAGLIHLFFNCFGLFIFGKLVEGVYGHTRFTVIYLLAGLSGSVLSYMFNPNAIAVGASGAIFGVLGAFAAYFVAHRGALGEMGRRNLTGLLAIAVINLVIGFIIPGIDNWAHLGGLAGGFVLGLALAPRYLYGIIDTPLGAVRRITGQVRIGMRWFAVPALAVLLAGVVWYAGTDVSDTQQSQIFVIRAERLLEEGDAMRALEHIERAIELDSLSARAFYTRGKIMARIGSTDRAKSDLSASLRLPGLDRASREAAISLLVSLP